MDWKKYEEQIFEIFKELYPQSKIKLDQKIAGLYSKTDRQIDILIEQHVAGNRIVIAIDGKYFNKKVDVKAVEGYIGMLEDIGAHKGLLISKEGFTEAAYNRAHFGPAEIELDVLNFEDLHSFQSHVAIPYAGNSGAILPAPFGWIIDGQTTDNWLATLYRRGRTLDQAVSDNEFLYVQFWDRHKDNHSLSDLLDIQKSNLLEYDPECSIEYLPTITRTDAETELRVAKIKNYPTPEYVGFVEFKDFIFYCVLFSPVNRSKSNIRKLENIMEAVLPIKVEHLNANKRMQPAAAKPRR